ncbi:Na+/H+ antiporter NhaC family protein, partial [Shewanella sp. 0m-11]
AKLLATWAETFLSAQMLVAGTFLLCAIMAFTTGSSWGTFAIMIPIGAEVALTVEPTLLLPALSAVMAGSVFGDHCSPISDTSVISALSSGCEPHAHVMTQLPFAIIAGISSLVGFQLVNLEVATAWSWLAVIIAAVSMLVAYQKLHQSERVAII